MAAPLTTFQAQAQAIYMNELVEIARAEAIKKGNKLSFDPQGRVIIEVTPDARQIAAIMRKIADAIQLPCEQDKKALEKAVGKTLTPTTIVSLDINTSDELKQIFNIRLAKALKKVEAENPRSPRNAAAIIKQLEIRSTGSLIALQQEYHFHLALVTRVYEKVAPDLPKDKMAAAHQAAMADVNELVMKAYAKALKEAMKEGNLDMAKLNKSLDKARKELLPKAHEMMMIQIVRHTGVILTQEQLKGVTNSDGTNETIKHIAEGTTATSNDVLHIDANLGLATLIAGSENTAHCRIQGRQFAHRQLITHMMKPDGSIEANKNPRIQIRTPSPVLKKGLADDNAYIHDVAVKLTSVKNDYALNEHLSSEEGKPKAFVYNSYTAINDTLGDINDNLQTQSAHHILRGAHRYNVRQLRTNPADPVFCFVQNISVNGFGDTLGYGTGNPLREESTLMAELALLHTLYETSSPAQQDKIGIIFDKYKEYLLYERRPSYFSNSAAGQDAKIQIETLKGEWRNAPAKDVWNEHDKPKEALKNLMAHNLHLSHEYAKLFQTLSVLTEEASIGGCKSGNERAQAINGRVALFDALQNPPLSPGMQEIATALGNLASGGAEVHQQAAKLKAALDAEYNKNGLQGAASIVSLVDQGASAKVEAKQSPIWWWTSRNYAEEHASIMNNLHQSKAGSMQAHKSLTKMMREAWDFQPKSLWERLKSSPIGVFGAIMAIVVSPIALGVLIYNAVDNKDRTVKRAAVHALKNETTHEKEDHKSWHESYTTIDIKLSGNTQRKENRASRARAVAQEVGASNPGLSIAANLQTTGPCVSSQKKTADADKENPLSM